MIEESFLFIRGEDCATCHGLNEVTSTNCKETLLSESSTVPPRQRTEKSPAAPHRGDSHRSPLDSHLPVRPLALVSAPEARDHTLAQRHVSPYRYHTRGHRSLPWAHRTTGSGAGNAHAGLACNCRGTQVTAVASNVYTQLASQIGEVFNQSKIGMAPAVYSMASSSEHQTAKTMPRLRKQLATLGARASRVVADPGTGSPEPNSLVSPGSVPDNLNSSVRQRDIALLIVGGTVGRR